MSHDHSPETKPVVLVALLANTAVAGLKFGAFALTGSAAMLSETYHSISDTGNQFLLLVGLSASTRPPTRNHPFGYGKDQFFYSFLVSVLLFGAAGLQSVREGAHALMVGDAAASVPSTLSLGGLALPGVTANYAVLLGVVACEGYSCVKAHRELTHQRETHGWDCLGDAFRRTTDMMTLTAFIEDSVAVAGATIALVGISLAQFTGNSVYDAAASVVIGVLLMTAAVALAWLNKRLLVGKSLPEPDERRLRRLVAECEAVVAVPEFRTVYFGPERVVVTAKVSFTDDLNANALTEWTARIEREVSEAGRGVRTVYLTPA